MNIVLIAYHYPPDRAVGSLRPAKVASALKNSGHDVTVITARLADEVAGTRSSEAGLTVIAIEPQKNPREWYVAWKKRQIAKGSKGSPSSTVPSAAYMKPTRTPHWKRAIFSLLWLPDDRQGFILPAIRAARRRLRQPGSVVYTTAPPFSTQLAGWWLKKRTKAHWVAEFRDPWTDNPWKPPHVRTRITDSIERMMERRVLKTADLVVAVTDGIGRVFRPKMAGREGRLVIVRNGIDELVPPERTRRPLDGPMRIVHVGSFYHSRDPRPFLRGLAVVRGRLGLEAKDLRVDLVGQCRWFAGHSIEKEVEMLGLQDLVHFQDWVPHAQAQEFIHSAHALLLLAQNQPDQVPNKLYEYLGARRPILAYVDDQGESAAMLRQVGGHHLVTDDDAGSSEQTLTRLVSRADVLPPDEKVLNAWTSQAQMRQLIERIGEI